MIASHSSSFRTCSAGCIRRASTVTQKSGTGQSSRGSVIARIPRRTSRPNISLARPRDWNRPLAPGVLPAYDEALKLIARDSRLLKEEAQTLRTSIAELEKSPDREDTELDAMRERLEILDIQSEVNLPSARWKCANGLADRSNPAHRHLLEQRWRDEGTLDLLMERMHQMHVIPDVLPSLHPSLDMRVTFPMPLPENPTRRQLLKPRYTEVEPGVYLRPEQTKGPPHIYANVFHTDTKLYTLLMIDPDVPHEAEHSFQTYLHWLQPNIPLSTKAPLKIVADSHTPYIPPHPQRGTPYHRYVTLLLPQVSELSIPVVLEDARLGFDVRAFLNQHSLDGSLGGGAHMWREEWDETVSQIYKDVLKTEEPRYGRPPKPDRYAEVKRIKRYAT